MGNEETTNLKNFNLVECRINRVNGLKNEAQSDFHMNNIHKNRNDQNPKGIKNLANKWRQSQNKSGTVQTQKNKRQYSKNPINSENMHSQMERAYRYMKSLNILQKYELNYNLEYPILILNKDKQIRKLRQEINKEKQNHSYFQTQQNKQSPQQLLDNHMRQKHMETEDIYKNDINFQGQKQIKEISLLKQQIFAHFKLIEKTQWIVIRIFQTSRHSKLLKHLKNLDNQYGINQTKTHLQKVTQFVKTIDQLEIQLMDMLYYQHKSNKTYQFNKIISNPLLIKSQHINVKQFIMQSQQNQQTPKYHHKSLNNFNHQNSITYEKYKQYGYEIYKQNQVSFYILAQTNQTFSPQLQPLELPSNPTIIETILEKYDAFAQLLQINQFTINILIDTKRTKKFNQIINKNQNRWQRLNIKVLKNQQLPQLDIQGNFIINQQQNNIKMASIGSGDLWNCIKQDLDQLKKFQYVEIIETKNCLQHGFDCFLLGKTQKDDLQWAIKMYEPTERLTELILINSQQKNFLNKDKNKTYFSLNQSLLSLIQYPHIIQSIQSEDSQNVQGLKQKVKQKEQPYYVLGGHSLFRMSYVKKVLQRIDKRQKKEFKMKTIKQGSEKLLVFQTNFLDQVFQFDVDQSQQKCLKSGLFLYEREDCYYPLCFKQNDGIFDVKGSSRTLSAKYLQELDLSVNKFINKSISQNTKCYIDPHVSFNELGLEDVKLQIQTNIHSILTSKVSSSYLSSFKTISNNTKKKFFSPNQKKDSNKKVHMFNNQTPRNSQLLQEFQSNSSNKQQVPYKVVSSISQILILSQQTPKSQKQITIFIN